MDLLNFLFLDSLYEFFNPKKRIFIGYLLIAVFIAAFWLVYFRKLNLREAINNNLGIKNIGPIFSYHCALTIFSCFLLSILSMIGIFLLLRINNRAKKALTSLIFAIVLFLSLFQQLAFLL